MKKVTEEKSKASGSGLDDLIQQGTRQIIQQVIEAELATLLKRFDNLKTLDGRRAVIRNGYLSEREIVTAIGPVTVEVPKVASHSNWSSRRKNHCGAFLHPKKLPRCSKAFPSKTDSR